MESDMSTGMSYNERLFGGGFRKWLHEARFHWLQHKCRSLHVNTASVLEIGCFDARSIRYLPTKPTRYFGFDANWEGGLDLARKTWRNEKQYYFVTTKTSEEVKISGGKVSLALSLETIEHIPPEFVNGYLQRVAKLLDGVFIVTVPNEKGIIFLGKYLVKKLVVGGASEYSAEEVVNATLGRMDRVERNDHKGFDWEQLLGQLREYFDVKEVEGVQFPWLPLRFNAQIGFVMTTRSSPISSNQG
jgi:hypothetical protein